MHKNGVHFKCSLRMSNKNILSEIIFFIAWISSDYFSRYYSLSNVWIDRLLMPSGDVKTHYPKTG